jgi:hypothetical protein
MTDERLPWYVRLVVGVGAWITAVVLMFLGGAIVFVALEFETGGALALIGAAYLWAGLRIIRQPDRGIFANQLGVATAAAGAALSCDATIGPSTSSISAMCAPSPCRGPSLTIRV